MHASRQVQLPSLFDELLLDQFLIGRWNTRNRATSNTNGRTSNSFDSFLCKEGVVHPGFVEVEGTFGLALFTISVGIDPGVSTMQELEQVILGLVVCACISNGRDGQLGVLHPVALLSTGAQCSAIESHNGRMPEIGVDAIKASRICHRHIYIVHPRHCPSNENLLFFRRVHVSLGSNDELRTCHGTVPPDFGVIAIVTDNHGNLESFGAFSYDGSKISGCPSFNGRPGQEFAVLLHHFALVVDENKGIVRILLGMLLMLFPREREHSPCLGLLASLSE
mmetsp:Transcript_19577/g.45579  ORF Transcript_19577/g.45579 Transcript_19577/m.45579 type:complete len:279 (+) Transcript_19577:693-1529(+)